MFKNETRSEEHNGKEHDALTTTHVRIWGTYTCYSSGSLIRYILTSDDSHIGRNMLWR
jgi:hypothetical protein